MATGFMLASAALLVASQVFYMSIDESLSMSDTVVKAEVTETITFAMDSGDRAEYFFRVIEVVSGDESLKGGFFADYFMHMPMAWIDEDGNEVWESPIVSGSGHEMSINKGDTVIVFLGYIPDDPTTPTEVVRIEPTDSLDTILLLISERSATDL